MNTGPVFR